MQERSPIFATPRFELWRSGVEQTWLTKDRNFTRSETWSW